MAETSMNLYARLLCGVAAITMAGAGAARAEDASFSISPQPLGAALNAFSEQSHHAVLFKPEMVLAKTSPGVTGVADPEIALAQVLNGAGLAYRRAGDAYVIVQAADGPQSGSADGGAETNVVQELVVTAQKKQENIQVVPIAISAFTQADLTTRQVAGGPDLMTQVPNMTFTKTNFSGYSIQIRGIGTQAISATTDPAVAVAFNNTPFIRNRFFEQEFYDLERVEVLRGPQGTLYGRNATAGVVNILSAKPADHYEAKLSGDVSNYKSSRLEGMINIPLVEDLASLRIAGAWTKRDGYVKNRLTGDQTDGRDLWSTRVTLGLRPADWLNVNLIWEHFDESDDRLRTGKQLCHADPGPSEVNGVPVIPGAAPIDAKLFESYVTQGCLPASFYSPDSFNTPNGYGLPYYGPLGLLGLPVYMNYNPYLNTFQSRNLREIETHIKPEYTAKSNLAELQATVNLPWNLSLTSETGFNRDFIFSFEDYNRFDTTPGVFTPGGAQSVYRPEDLHGPGDRLDLTDLNGVFCDPQLGCTNRLAAGDLSTARSQQFSQEFRLSSDYDGPFNFNLGANFLRYDTDEKYYVFINTLTMFGAQRRSPWIPGVSDRHECLTQDGFYGRVISDPTRYYSVVGCIYIDPNDIHHLNDQGRNYFLSKNPYHLLSYAAFGEAYYNVTPQVKVTAGLRWTVDKKTAPVIPSWLLAGPDGINFAGPNSSSYGLPTYKVIEQEWREPTGRVAIDWKPELGFTDQTLVYGSYVRGYKAGGANPPPPVLVLATVCPPDCPGAITNTLTQHYLTHPETFAPEFVNAFEIGMKNTLLDGRLTANLSAFYYDYKGYQISQIVDRSAVNLNFDATVKGLELELDWRPIENLRLGFKGGYEDTRVADGMKAIDTMDRTAGKEGWMLFRPFPSLPSNCVIPKWLVPYMAVSGGGSMGMCAAYSIGVDLLTYLPYVPNPTESRFSLPPGYPGYDPTSANNGQGFLKDLSGNELPNAPHYTATITADYTLPLSSAWLMTLHTDLYYQSEAWTRIFNTPGYDKLKAYNNVNLAAIFSNEEAGWQVMAYVKNVFDKDNITGAFLNSDDTGLTTNVFLNEPRLYGLRVTKNFSGGTGWIAKPHTAGAPYALTVELGSEMARLDAPAEVISPFQHAFTGALDPSRPQTEDLDWTHQANARVTWQPSGSPWKLSGGVRYGRTSDQTGRRRQQEVTGGPVCKLSQTGPIARFAKELCDPDYVLVFYGQVLDLYDPTFLLSPTDRLSTSTNRQEKYRIADFSVGKDVGLGSGLLRGGHSSLSFGLRYAGFKSSMSGDMRGVPDIHLPDDAWFFNNTTFHQYIDSFQTERKFTGIGPTLSWEGAAPLWGADKAARLNLDWALTGGVLFGKQKTAVSAAGGSDYFNAPYPAQDYVLSTLPPPTQTPIAVAPRRTSAKVPMLDLSVGFSLEASGVKLSTGYRWERYFNVLDAGFEQRKSYDRTIDGPYFKVSVGFGG